jgi:hypothetical protein
MGVPQLTSSCIGNVIKTLDVHDLMPVTRVSTPTLTPLTGCTADG